MTAGALVVLLVAALAVSALAGPRLLRHAAPALTRLPRVAAGLLAGGTLAWVFTALALGPLLAWVVSGPALLPGHAAEVCRRCLAAANPFSGTPLYTAVPALLLLVLPALAATVLGVAVVREIRRRRRATAHTGRRLRDRGEPRTVLGHRVLVIDDPRPFALTLPRRHGGITASTGALRALAPDELAAVLAHEHAHLSQRHHLITTVMASVSRHLSWVPLIAAGQAALGHYLEIAADDAARRRAGTPALARALLTLGEHAPAPLDGALHMLGPDRIRHLVRPSTGASGVLPALAATAYLTGLVLLAGIVHVPYVVAALQGCA
ncbi:M56 family metallopeptidase [Nonomuraea sp. NPDC049649]|uniref:M56 family metallopeptidase n=1 Tax=Nonomuraea sp. NPDC049649 TaxID=3155776 RepID=UPI00343F6104